MDRELANTALLVIDVQVGFDDPVWGRRNNPECEANVAALIGGWRSAGRPIVFVRHDSVTPGSPLVPEQPGNDFKPVVDGDPDLLVAKQVNSAFYGEPDLHAWLQGRGITGVAIAGIQTNFCCETTARMAGNLGYIGEVCINDDERGRYGNYLYGAFGRDFATGDGKRIMLIALTAGQWRG